MKKVYIVGFVTTMLCSLSLLPGDFVKELVKAQEERGIRVASPEEKRFENQTKDLLAMLTTFPLTSIQNDPETAGTVLTSFYNLFFDPEFIKFSTRTVMNDFFEQLKTWHDTLKKKNVTIAFPSNKQSKNLQQLLLQALKEICLFGRYSKYKEEHLVTFKLRLQYILTNIMMDSYLTPWKNELITNNPKFSLGSFYSWDVAMLKSEFKDSAALAPLFTKLSSTIDTASEKQAAALHEQEVAQEKELTAQRKQQESLDLISIITQTEQQLADKMADKGTVYCNCIRILLDPAYMELSAADRKRVATINEQFKKLHSSIGKTFVPVLSQEEFETLKLLTAKALETIASPTIGKTGGVMFKNNVEFVLKTIMPINKNQTLIENQIKFQWIKPLYLDNQFLTPATKKKLFDLFNNENFQRWQASTRTMTLKLSPSPKLASPAPTSIEPSPITTQKSEQPAPTSVITSPTKTPTVTTSLQSVVTQEGTAPTPFEIIEPQPAAPQQPTPSPQQAPEPQPAPQPVEPPSANADIQQIGTTLISQALVAPLATIKNTLSTVAPQQQSKALMVTDAAGYTAIHQAASLARADVLETLLKNLTPDEKFAIMSMREKDGQTPLHLVSAAKSAPTKGFNPVNAAKELLKGLTLQQQVKLITEKDNSGTTPIDLAQGANKALAINLKEILQKGGVK